MKQVVLKWSGKTVSQKMEKASFVVQKMTENAGVFPNPDPVLADLTAQIEKLNAANVNASQGGQDRTALRDQELEKLETMMDRQVLYVQTVTLGDPDMTALAGMETRDDPSPRPVPQKPQNFRAKPGEYLGSTYLICDPVKYKREYVYQIYTENEDGTGQWEDLETSGRYSITIHGLERGKVYRFRVYVLNAAGQSPYSDEASCPAR